MAYTAPPTKSTGNTLAAADWNTYIRDDMEAVAKSPAALVYSTSNQSIPNNTFTNVTFSASLTLRGCTFGSSTITVGETGLYMLTASGVWSAFATGDREILVLVNGTGVRVVAHLAGASYDTQQSLSTVYPLSATDTVTMQAVQNSGGALNLKAGSSMAVHMLSRT